MPMHVSSSSGASSLLTAASTSLMSRYASAMVRRPWPRHTAHVSACAHATRRDATSHRRAVTSQHRVVTSQTWEAMAVI